MNKNMQLLLALGAGVIAYLGNNFYLNERELQLVPREFETVLRTKKQVQAGTMISTDLIEPVRVPKIYLPKSAIRDAERNAALGQPVNVDINAGDYLLNTYFRVRASVGDRLSDQVDNANFRAITIPVDDINSLARSVQTGDKIDILFTFSVPGVASKFSTLLLQNVPVIATGPYSAAQQELIGSDPQKRYGSLTLRLPTADAIRLNYARQAGQIGILLRKGDDSNPVDAQPITSLKDLLTAQERESIEKAVQQAATTAAASSDKFKDQIREVLEKQRLQQGRP